MVIAGFICVEAGYVQIYFRFQSVQLDSTLATTSFHGDSSVAGSLDTS